MYRGPVIEKLDGALGAQASNDDNIQGFCFGGVTTAGYPTLGTVVKLIQASDADTLGFTAASDIANKVLIRYHIDEFFRRNPNGVLWINVVAQGTTMAQMCDVANNHVKKIVTESLKTVKEIGVVLNPAAGYTPTLTNGLDGDVLTAVTKAQQLIDSFADQNCFINTILLEGRQVNGTLSAIKDLRTLASPNVQITILQDPDVAALDALFAKTAAVGTILGDISIRRVEEDLGALQIENNPNKAVSDYPINNVAAGLFLKVGISSGVETKTLTDAEIQLLKTNGYIFADTYPAYNGVFISGSPTCTALTSDFAWSTNVRVWNKAARLAVTKLTPKINSQVEVDDAGKLKSTTVTTWQLDVNNTTNGLGSLVTNRHCLKSAVYINPNQDVYSTNKVIVGMTVKPYGYAREIVGQLGFSRN